MHICNIRLCWSIYFKNWIFPDILDWLFRNPKNWNAKSFSNGIQMASKLRQMANGLSDFVDVKKMTIVVVFQLSNSDDLLAPAWRQADSRREETPSALRPSESESINQNNKCMPANSWRKSTARYKWMTFFARSVYLLKVQCNQSKEQILVVAVCKFCQFPFKIEDKVTWTCFLVILLRKEASFPKRTQDSQKKNPMDGFEPKQLHPLETSTLFPAMMGGAQRTLILLFFIQHFQDKVGEQALGMPPPPLQLFFMPTFHANISQTKCMLVSGASPACNVLMIASLRKDFQHGIMRFRFGFSKRHTKWRNPLQWNLWRWLSAATPGCAVRGFNVAHDQKHERLIPHEWVWENQTQTKQSRNEWEMQCVLITVGWCDWSVLALQWCIVLSWQTKEKVSETSGFCLPFLVASWQDHWWTKCVASIHQGLTRTKCVVLLPVFIWTDTPKAQHEWNGKHKGKFEKSPQQ